jgi:hypothetical protein
VLASTAIHGDAVAMNVAYTGLSGATLCWTKPLRGRNAHLQAVLTIVDTL